MISSQIWQCLDLDLLEGAEVLAEQLIAHGDDAESRYLHAHVLSRRRQFESVKASLRPHARTHIGCSWLYARACRETSALEEGIATLEATRSRWALENDLSLPTQFGRGELTPAAFHLLLAQLHKPGSDQARHEYTESARLNPYLIENVFSLCRSATARVKGKHMFSRFGDPFETSVLEPSVVEPDSTPVGAGNTVIGVSTTNSGAGLGAGLGGTIGTLGGPINGGTLNGGTLGGPLNGGPLNGGPLNGGPLNGGPLNGGTLGDHLNGGTLGALNGALGAHATGGLPILGAPPITQASTPRRATPRRALNTPMTFARVHTPPNLRASTQPLPRRPTRPSASFRNDSFRSESFNSLGRGLFDSPARAASEASGVDALELLVDALELVSQCEFAAAAALLDSLALACRAAPFVLALRACLHLEVNEMEACVEAFKELHTQQPDRARDMEIYSAALWHLRREPQLALLGFEFTHSKASTRHCWQSWCVLGNAFSLRHDSSDALKCFERACQLKETAFAYTLLGYEYMAVDELSKASEAFTHALAITPEHYNAWYGLATACYSLAYVQEAYEHASQALRLNPYNAVMHCFMGAVLAETGKPVEALAHYNRACQLDPKSPTPKFRKADALIQMGEDDEALKILLEVEQLAPEDADIQLELGELFKRLGEGERAVQYFTRAHQLDPKSGTRIRKLLEAI